jgi:hypothetical protein
VLGTENFMTVRHQLLLWGEAALLSTYLAPP